MGGYAAIQTRFVHVVGWKGEVLLWWGTCGNFHHRLHHELRRGEGPKPADLEEVWGGYLEWEPEPGAACEQCAEPYPGTDAIGEDVYLTRSAACRSVYDTEDGDIGPGCMYWETNKLHEDGICTFNRWTNCDGRHLIVVLPNNHHWDVDSRANNCDKPDDTTHRCWQRTGDPETGKVTAGKSPPTCTAGAGSILSGDYHGFLIEGELSAG